MGLPQSGSPLNSYVESAGSAEMREIARFALLRGLNQEKLAAKIGVATTTVSRHFDSKRPRDVTLKRYADKLEMPIRQLRLAGGAQLGDGELREARRFLVMQLRFAEPEFEAGAIDHARTAFDEFPATRQRRMLSSLQLATDRFHAGMLKWDHSDWPLVSPMVEEWARQLLPDYDLLGKRRKLPKPVGETLLRDLYHLLTVKHWLAPSQADIILDLVRTALRSFGANTKPMDEYLSADKLTYKPGRLDQPRHVSLDDIHKLQKAKSRKIRRRARKRM